MNSTSDIETERKEDIKGIDKDQSTNVCVLSISVFSIYT